MGAELFPPRAFFEGCAGSCYGLIHIGGIGFRYLYYRLPRRRIDCRKGFSRGRINPLIVNQQFCCADFYLWLNYARSCCHASSSLQRSEWCVRSPSRLPLAAGRCTFWVAIKRIPLRSQNQESQYPHHFSCTTGVCSWPSFRSKLSLCGPYGVASGAVATACRLVTATATSNAHSNNSPARKYGAPGRCTRADGEIAVENTCVNSSGPAIPVRALSELIAPCSFPCDDESTLCDISDCIAGPATPQSAMNGIAAMAPQPRQASPNPANPRKP